MRTMILTLMVAGVSAYASKYDLIYITQSGKRLSAEAGILAAASGEVVYKCQTVEAKVSKSGTSVSLRNIKKPKSKEEIEQQIEELKKQAE